MNIFRVSDFALNDFAFFRLSSSILKTLSLSWQSSQHKIFLLLLKNNYNREINMALLTHNSPKYLEWNL